MPEGLINGDNVEEMTFDEQILLKNARDKANARIASLKA